MVYQTILHGILFAYEQFFVFSVYKLPRFSSESEFENTSYSEYGRDILWAQQNYYRFYTNWNCMLQYLFIILLLAEDFLRLSNTFPKAVHDKFSMFNSYIFFSLVFPVCLIVASTFWGIYWYNPELIWPKFADLLLPFEMNLMIHGVIFIVVLLILVTYRRPLPKLWVSMVILFLYNGAYGLLSLETWYETGHWIYPFQNKIELIYNVVSVIPLHVAAFVFLFIGRLLSSLIHGEVVQDKNKFNVQK